MKSTQNIVAKTIQTAESLKQSIINAKETYAEIEKAIVDCYRLLKYNMIPLIIGTITYLIFNDNVIFWLTTAVLATTILLLGSANYCEFYRTKCKKYIQEAENELKALESSISKMKNA